MTDFDASAIHRLDQASTPTRHLAELLAQFRAQLIEEGFTPEGAEQVCDTFCGFMMMST